MRKMLLGRICACSHRIHATDVRRPTILGIVGAGSIDMEIKTVIELIDFSRLFTLTAIVLLLVTIIDQINWLVESHLKWHHPRQ